LGFRYGEDSSPREHVCLVLEVQILQLLGPVGVKVWVIVAIVQKAVDLWRREFARQRSGALWRLKEMGQRGGLEKEEEDGEDEEEVVEEEAGRVSISQTGTLPFPPTFFAKR